MSYRFIDPHYSSSVASHKALSRNSDNDVRDFTVMVKRLSKGQLKLLRNYIETLRARAKDDLKLLASQKRYAGKGPNFLALLSFDPTKTLRDISTYLSNMKAFSTVVSDELKLRGRKSISKRAKDRKGSVDYV